TVEDVQYLLTFGIMLAVGLIISGLTDSVRARARAQAKLEAAAETERLRSTLLASISHDLRTPLAVMSGASSSLAERGERLSAQEREALAKSIFAQSRELSERVAKVLQMTRLEAGSMTLARDWASVAEIGGPAGGIGLGLAIARAIVRLHGGRTWAERLAMGGTAFRFTLPVEEMPAIPAETAAAAP